MVSGVCAAFEQVPYARTIGLMYSALYVQCGQKGSFSTAVLFDEFMYIWVCIYRRRRLVTTGE